VFADLDGDGVEEFVLLGHWLGNVYQLRAGHWEYVGRMNQRYAWGTEMLDGVRGGNIRVELPRWRRLWIGGQLLDIEDTKE
jgi:hypothetical protein